jgi:hypothetical protein
VNAAGTDPVREKPMRNRFVVLLGGAVAAAGCGDMSDPAGLPADPEATAVEATAAWRFGEGGGGLDVYNGGARRAPRLPCVFRRESRQFDFWVGRWEVTSAAGVPSGTNIVRWRAEGCVVEENWTDASGGRGRSLNMYDDDTGEWHQTWVSAFDTGHSRMSGGLVDGVMVMDGVRTQPNGVQWFDAYSWTRLDWKQLVQAGSLRIPAAAVDINFALTYTRALHVNPAAEVETTSCKAGGRSAAARQLDYWHGRWRVSEGGKRLGISTVGSDLSGCLTEEAFGTGKGFESVSYAYYDLVEQRWYRTYTDSEGERVELRGEVGADGSVMTATEPGSGNDTMLVRVTLSPVTTDVVHQVWETSKDDGASWKEALRLVYERT